MKKLLLVFMLMLSAISFGETLAKASKVKAEKLILKNFKEDQLALNEIVSLTSYIDGLNDKKGILYIIANTDEKFSYDENEELAQSRIAFVSSIIDMNVNSNKKGIEYKCFNLGI